MLALFFQIVSGAHASAHGKPQYSFCAHEKLKALILRSRKTSALMLRSQKTAGNSNEKGIEERRKRKVMFLQIC